MTNAEARFNNSLRPRKPEGSLGRTAQDVHLDSHTAPELCLVILGSTSTVIHSVNHAYSEIGPEVRCDLSRLLARKITKRIHSSKPASLNRPIYISIYLYIYIYNHLQKDHMSLIRQPE